MKIGFAGPPAHKVAPRDNKEKKMAEAQAKRTHPTQRDRCAPPIAAQTAITLRARCASSPPHRNGAMEKTFRFTGPATLTPAATALLPPMYINVGAHVGEGAMVDSHALVGTCAQVGRGVHVSAACQVGGVLEPAGARPVIIEDGAFLGGNTGLYEGVLVGAGAVLASGVVLTATTPLFDLVREETLTGTPEAPLQVPAGAVVVPGVRALETEYARAMGLSASCAIVVKYRDEGTDARTALEEALR